jgi:AraC family transcriptional regulator, positive regulator of tynA and feaB
MTLMETIFSTAGLHPRDRFDYWHEVACKTIVVHNSQPERRLTFEAELNSALLGDVQVLLFRNSPMRVARTQRHIAQAKHDDLFICQQLGNKIAIEQSGQEVVLKANDFCLLDPMLPYRATFEDGSRLLVLKLPRRALEALTGKPGTTAQALNVTQAGRFTADYLRILPTHASRIQGAADLVRNQVLDLVALSAATRRGETPPRSHTVALLRLQAAVEARLHNVSLTPSTAAAAAGISVRYANVLLATEKTSLARFILTSRLDRCRRALADELQRNRTITEIAFAWGFASMPHFSRSFTKIYGIPPREYRTRRFGRRER